MQSFRLVTAWILAGYALAAAQPAAQPAGTSATTQPALPEISWEAAREHLGKECAVVGKIIMTRNIGSRCFLNFHENFRENFTVVIQQESFARFPTPPEELYADKRVRVTGKIIDFQGKPEIIVTGPEQIVILDGGAAATTPPADAGTSTRPAAPTGRAEGTPPPRPAPPFDGTVTVATYNVLNLFDEHDDPYHADEGTGAKPRDQREKVAATFRKINADVVALQEVENREVLEEFNATLLADLNYREVVLFEGNDRRGIDVAVLSRFPVGPVTSHRHLTHPEGNGRTARFRRDLLRVRIEPPDAVPFDLFVTHLKSKGGDGDTTVIRQAEAASARAVLDKVLKDEPDAHFLFCGDLNDTFDSQPIKTLVGSGAGMLHAFFDGIAEPQRETYNTAPHKSMIDFILASPAMAARFETPSYRIIYGSIETSGSDHNPVVARFKLR